MRAIIMPATVIAITHAQLQDVDDRDLKRESRSLPQPLTPYKCAFIGLALERGVTRGTGMLHPVVCSPFCWIVPQAIAAVVKPCCARAVHHEFSGP